jgi:anthranilate synthase component 2
MSASPLSRSPARARAATRATEARPPAPSAKRAPSRTAKTSPPRRGALRPRVLLIDNYDSFTFNLVQRLGELGAETEVLRNDALTVDELVARAPERLVISPGPCTPTEAGISVAAIRRLCGLDGAGAAAGAGCAAQVPILGVCLGHQSIGAAFGARVVRAPAPVHGKAEEIVHDGSALFKGAPRRLLAGRYHSLVVEEKSLPRALAVSARTLDGIVMALRHRTLPVFGVQFHPESILTPEGQTLLRNFLAVPGARSDA